MGSRLNQQAVTLEIDGKVITVPAELSVRKAALKNGIYIPGLCSHPDLNPFKPFDWSKSIWQGEQRYVHSGAEDEKDFPHCDLCLVSINGGTPQRACTTRVAEGMVVETTGTVIQSARRESLKRILANHPHACLTCAQKEGCDRVQCSMNVPVEERCCELLGRCEIGKVAEFIGIPGDTPAYRPGERLPVPDEPLFVRDYDLCVSCMKCVRICRDVRQVDILGAVYTDGKALVGSKAEPTLVDAACRFCGACVEICPTGALRDKDGLEPLVDGLAPCAAKCPLGIDIPGYLELISQGLVTSALELIREKAVLPGVLGYACFHPCETVCRRGDLDDPVAICAVKRFASDFAELKKPSLTGIKDTGQRVAVIGSGPAGLAAAAELLRRGHSVTVIEREKELGGMLRQTIPGFRLPDEVIDRDLEYLFELGLKARNGIEINSDYNPKLLLVEEYDAVIVAVGLPRALKLDVEGEELEGVHPGLDLLRKARHNEAENFESAVAVIGGGSVAADAAMTARRLGSDDVTMICLESESEMPVSTEELEAAVSEGIKIVPRWGIRSFDGKNGRVERILLQRCTRVFNRQGRFSPEYDPDETMVFDTENVIVAIGQGIEESYQSDWVETDGVFTAGDVSTGPSSIVEAMASGIKVASEVDAYLKGHGRSNPIVQYPIGNKQIGSDPDFHTRPRVIPRRLDPARRVNSMSLIESTIDADQASSEASRCLRCHLRATMTRAPLPPDPWHRFESGLDKLIPPSEGVIILADQDKRSVKIAGYADIKAAFIDLIDEEIEAEYCRWEVDPMYTKRESELNQAYLQAFGELPGADELDDLF